MLIELERGFESEAESPNAGKPCWQADPGRSASLLAYVRVHIHQIVNSREELPSPFTQQCDLMYSEQQVDPTEATVQNCFPLR